MNKKIIMPGLVSILLLTGCAAQSQEPQDQNSARTVNVQTTVLQPQSFERYLRLVGTVESENDVQLAAEVAGRIERYYVEQGAYVREGQAILKINDDKLQSEQARLKAQTVQAREKYQRLKRIFEQDSIGSKMGVIEAKTNYLQSKAALKGLTVDLQNTTVRAPFSGVLNEKLAEVGEMASPGMPLVRLISTGNLKITAGVPSRYSNDISTGDMAKVWFDFEPGDTLKLPVAYVSQSINPDSRTFEIEVNLPADTKNFKVDMIANVKLRTLTKDSAMVIEKEHVFPEQDSYYVFTLAQNDSSKTIGRRQKVRLGPSYKNRVVIKSGLQFGDTLITAGSSFLDDGMRVSVTDSLKNES